MQKITDDKNLIFIGMMGAGKTSVGKACAKSLSRQFVDCDHLYTDIYGDISKTFLQKGEAVFRERENEILKRLAIIKNAVIATGGGAVLSSGFELLKNSGIVIYLKASQVTLSQRLDDDTKNRPLNKGIQSIGEILAVRQPLYQKYADVIIETDNLSLAETVDKILVNI